VSGTWLGSFKSIGQPQEPVCIIAIWSPIREFDKKVEIACIRIEPALGQRPKHGEADNSETTAQRSHLIAMSINQVMNLKIHKYQPQYRLTINVTSRIGEFRIVFIIYKLGYHEPSMSSTRLLCQSQTNIHAGGVAFDWSNCEELVQEDLPANHQPSLVSYGVAGANQRE